MKVLVTDNQAELIEEQWSIVNGTHDEYLARKQKIEGERSTGSLSSSAGHPLRTM